MRLLRPSIFFLDPDTLSFSFNLLPLYLIRFENLPYPLDLRSDSGLCYSQPCVRDVRHYSDPPLSVPFALVLTRHHSDNLVSLLPATWGHFPSSRSLTPLRQFLTLNCPNSLVLGHSGSRETGTFVSPGPSNNPVLLTTYASRWLPSSLPLAGTSSAAAPTGRTTAAIVNFGTVDDIVKLRDTESHGIRLLTVFPPAAITLDSELLTAWRSVWLRPLPQTFTRYST